MDALIDKYQVVIFRSPYEIMSMESERDFFLKICELKIAGYSKEYPSGVLPFDTCDFVANHVVLCEKQPHGLNPIMGFKSVDLATCDYHRVSFPILGMLKSIDDTSLHALYFEQLIANYRSRGLEKKLAYNGSFTVHPRARADVDFMSMMWDLGFFLTAGHYLTEGTEHVIAVCATKFKVDRKKKNKGWEYCQLGGHELPNYRSNSLFEADLVPMELQNIKTKCLSYFEPYSKLWDKRIVLENTKSDKVAA